MRVCGATLLRRTLFLQETQSPEPRPASLIDVGGRKIMDLKAGANDVSNLAPGVYFIRSSRSAPARKVVIQN